MNENNKVTTLNLSDNKIGDVGVSSLSIALMNENNKVITLNLRKNKFGTEGVKSLSTALMNKNNKVTRLILGSNYIGTSGLLALLQGLQFSLVNCLDNLGQQRELDPKVEIEVAKFSSAFNQHIRHLVCLASVRTIRRIGERSHFKMLPSDLIRKAAQTLGWFINRKEALHVLE